MDTADICVKKKKQLVMTLRHTAIPLQRQVALQQKQPGVFQQEGLLYGTPRLVRKHSGSCLNS